MLVKTDSPGRPPRLSHSSWTMTQIMSDVSFISDHVAYVSTNKTKIVWIEMELFSFLLSFNPGASCLRACLDAMSLSQFHLYPDLSEGADRVGGQLLEGKDCPFSGVTRSGRVWRKMPESDARRVGLRFESALALLSLQKLWSVDTVLWLCPSQLMEHSKWLSASFSENRVKNQPKP